jgi:hypothetical protein
VRHKLTRLVAGIAATVSALVTLTVPANASGELYFLIHRVVEGAGIDHCLESGGTGVPGDEFAAHAGPLMPTSYGTSPQSATESPSCATN